MKLKKIILKSLSLIICFSVVFSGTTFAFNEVSDKTLKRYIVVLEDPHILSENRPSLFGISSEEYDNAMREYLISVQQEVKSKIPQNDSSEGFLGFDDSSSVSEFSFTDVLNGFTVTTDESTAQYIKNIDGVLGVYEDELLDAVKPVEKADEEIISEASTEEVQTSNISLANSGSMIGVEDAYEKGYNGEGRTVAIIDTTIFPNNSFLTLSDDTVPMYSESDIINIVTEKCTNIPVDKINGVYKSEKIPFAFNYATGESDLLTNINKHGVHVAGISAGNSVSVSDGIIKGVAPEAQIIFCSVADASGNMYTSSVIAALEDISHFDVDSVNLSLGSDAISENDLSEEHPYYVAVKSLNDSGKMVVYAAGNSDKLSGLTEFIDYSVADNRHFSNSLKIGSVQNNYVYSEYLEDENGTKYPCGVKGTYTAFSDYEIVNCGNGSAEELSKVALDSDKIALCFLPDEFIFSESVSALSDRVKNAGAGAVLIAYNAEAFSNSSMNKRYPVFVVSKSVGEKVNSATKISFTNDMAVVKAYDKPTVSEYSSYSYSDGLEIGIDFSAPGGNIFSSFGALNTFANNSGTSMAAPQVSGAVSLMYKYVEEAFPDYSGKGKMLLVKNLLASTAENIYTPDGAIASPRKIGSGLIRLDKAMETKVILKGKNSEDTKINLGVISSFDEPIYTFNVDFTAYNLSDSAVNFKTPVVELSSDDYKFYGDDKGYGYYGLKKLDCVVSGGENITVPANSTADISLSVALSEEDVNYLKTAMVNGFFVDGKVTLKSDNNCDIGIPLSGFFGDWYSMPTTTLQRFCSNTKFIHYFNKTKNVNDNVYSMPLIDGENIILPITANPADDIKNLVLDFVTSPLRNAYVTIKVDENTVLNNCFYNKMYISEALLSGVNVKKLSEANKITVEMRLPYDVNGENLTTCDILISHDNKAPQIADAYVEDGKIYLETSDNVRVGKIICNAVNTSGKIAFAFFDKNISKATVDFAINQLDKFSFKVYDTAFNYTDLLPEIKYSINEDTVTFTNNTHEEISGICLLAVYENGKTKELVKLSENVVDFDAYSEKSYNISSYKDCDYKIFFWKDLVNIEPLCEVNN